MVVARFNKHGHQPLPIAGVLMWLPVTCWRQSSSGGQYVVTMVMFGCGGSNEGKKDGEDEKEMSEIDDDNKDEEGKENVQYKAHDRCCGDYPWDVVVYSYFENCYGGECGDGGGGGGGGGGGCSGCGDVGGSCGGGSSGGCGGSGDCGGYYIILLKERV
ncbi:hypothetical protein LguiA_034621 [Lonicera macranthoides]